ncbi:hypothetical protein EI285_03930 [Aliarcobacter skirrowii]|uniref:DUF6232 family protein n=1 Tax=Aliarcobacter skirrowii TaxID=28200 RepID=UPI000F690CFC|nr:DUF6232 family protein [Aliarcobacter skirrowii]AZL53772.1 hypothetical protein EI285_03930 [Aliarcobacter skirrowii]
MSNNEQVDELELFQKKLSETNKLNLNITNNLIEIGNSVYPVRNIASTKIIEKNFLKHEYYGGNGKLAIISFLMIITIFFGTIFTTIVAILGAYGFYKSLKKSRYIPYNYYGLSLVTNGGTSDLLFSDDKEFILKISKIISNALIEKQNIQYSIHIGDKNFIDNSKTQITNNINLHVEHHQGLSKEDLEFLMGDFKYTMEKLYSELSNIKEAQVSKEELENIVNEINSKEPNVSKIKKSWEIIKKACDGYDTITTLSDFGSMIGRATMIFI